jgi:CheY-like chemotaxis protein
MVIPKQLEKLGLSTELAEDGLQAVAAVKVNAFDLIFMDVMMPNMDGLEATKQIREFERKAGRQRTVIVGVTGYTNRAECIAAGMDDFMCKPVTIEQLKGTIKNWYPDWALPQTSGPSHLFADEKAPLETSDLTDQRIAELKSRLGYDEPS